MSRLTSRAPFNRPSVLDVLQARPAPLSPPETELEPGPPLQEEVYVSPEPPADAPIPRIRKSTIGYSSGSLSNRDPRPIQKQQRWLVMVVPPASLTHEPPILGHTLSSAPAGRFSNGILMPLFPTLYGQLTAIAREFNMPSTAGLCVYLQLQDSGPSVLTPRISDESWPLLWGHFFVGQERVVPLPPHGLPISGRIEFDIDLRRAKWFNTWIGHPARERAESEAMFREPSVLPMHWRSDSRTTLFPSEQTVEESPSPPDVNPQGVTVLSRPTLRHLPRPLLLDRRDASSVRSFSRHPSRAPSISNDLHSPEPLVQAASAHLTAPTFVPNALSPVVQEQEEPQTAKRAELDSLVRQWRQTSVVGAASTALAAAGQLSLDPVNMPAGTDVELDFNDFAWSISSAGPPTESPLSPHWPDPLPSVHLQGRLQGSVCLTPSVCTSFGPPDYDWPESPISCVSRRPSPDLGMRMLDVVCLTPTTATSWGPDDLPSPMSGECGSHYQAPSVDIGVRGMGSRPVTPSTATSWGPPDSPSILPDSPVRIRTPDAGERVLPGLEITRERPRAPVFPYYNAWSTQPWEHIWPYQLYQAHNRRRNEQIELSMPVPDTRRKVLLPEWPDFAALYPSDPSMERSAANKCQPVCLAALKGYPILEIYPPVYPYTLDHIYPVQEYEELYVQGMLSPTIAISVAPSKRGMDLHPEWPDFAALYPSSAKTNRVVASKSQPVSLLIQVEYPFFNIYPSVYPHHLDELYPTLLLGQSLQGSPQQEVMGHATLPLQDQNATAASPAPSTDLVDRFPKWPDYAVLYSGGSIMEQATANKCQTINLPQATGYPFLEIYPTAYPYNLDQIYPTLPPNRGAAIDNPASKPLTNGRVAQLMELLPQWPDFMSLYPIDPSGERASTNKSQSVSLQRRDGYPSVIVYPAVYPYSLQEIYSDVQPTLRPPSMNLMVTEVSTVKAHQPLLEYPDFAGLYPSDPSTERVGANKSQLIGLHSAEYPFLTIYPHVYPFNLAEIYGPYSSMKTVYEETVSCEDIPIRLPAYSGYPSFNLYPASQGFPTFEIYPPIRPQDSLAKFTASVNPTFYEETASCEDIPIRLPAYSGYPSFNLYPASQGFPTFEIYPPTRPQNSLAKFTTSVKLTSAYPVIELYEPVYPYFVIYPQTQLTVADEDLPLSPISYRRRAPTPGPGRHRAHLSRSLLITGQQPNTQRRSSRSPVQRELTPSLPSNSPVTMAKLSGNDPLRGKSRETHLDLHLGAFGVDSTPTLPMELSQSYAPRHKPRRTHHDLHLLVFGNSSTNKDLSKEDTLISEDSVPELPSRSAPTPAPGRARQRNRSGTISSRPAAPEQPISSEPQAIGTSNAKMVTRSSRGPYASTKPIPSLPGWSTPHDTRSNPIPPSDTAASSLGRRRPISGLPSSPAEPKMLLSRVRSMNSHGTQHGVSQVATEPQGLDRSKSLSDTNRVGTNRVLQTKMFTVLEQGSEASGVPTYTSQSSTSRSVPKVERSNLPFA